MNQNQTEKDVAKGASMDLRDQERLENLAAARPSRASRREWIGLAIIALPCVLYSMDFTVLHLAVPHLSAALQPSSSQLLWIVDIYGFLLAGALMPMGVLGDRIGRRKLLLIGAAVFGLASILAAFSTSAGMLIAARALLGVAASTLAPSTLALIRNMFFDPRQRTVAIGVWVASFSAGGAIGPLVGGALLASFWWGSVFLVAVPVMLLLLALGPVFLPEYRDRNAGRVDLPSAALSLMAVLAVIYGIQSAAENGAGWRPSLVILVGLVIAALFLRRQQTLRRPFLDLKLFRLRSFSVMLLIYLLGFFVLFPAFFFLTQYLQLVLGMGPLSAGLWTLPWAVSQIVGSLLTPVIVRRVQAVFVIAASLMLAAIGFGILTQIGGSSDLWIIVAGSVLVSFGLIPVITLATDLIVGTVPPERAGMASGLSETSSELGGALGIALLGSAATALYRSKIESTLPGGVPPHVAQVARGTLGGALSVASQVPHAPGLALIASARAAFADASVLVFSLCGGIALLAALAAVVLLRGRTGVISPDQQPEAAPHDGAKKSVA
jgi:DHA2 family multidrug resistance protein-like MFS transporter